MPSPTQDERDLYIGSQAKDFTFKVTWQPYSYGLLSAVVYKQINGRWRKSFPLQISCYKTEKGAAYEECLVASR